MNRSNVKVAVRVRPMSENEIENNCDHCLHICDDATVLFENNRRFEFEYAFNESCDQKHIYDKTMNSLIDELFLGFNVTVFAYGQTGSGKTYTIGDDFNLQSESKGLIVRSIQEIFIKLNSNSNFSSSVQVSYLEVYKEEIIDLLALKRQNIYIREDSEGNSVIMGALEKQCKSINNVIECLELGFANQHFGLTNMNDRSSRSHTLLSLTICENINANFSAVQSKIHFVDLAGSERVEKTGNIGNRLKESVYINSGLLALGNVIHSLTDKRKAIHRHIPYRQSKITRLLKDSLGGNSHTLMICCISPASSNIDETLNSLKYASRARHIKNKPILNFSRSASANVTQIEDKMPEYIQNERAKTVSLLKMKLHSKNKEKTYIDIHQESLLKSKLVEKNREMQNLLYKMGQQKILIRDMAILIDQNVLPDSMKKRIHNFSSFCNTIKSNNDDLVGQFKVYQSELHKNDYIIEKKEKESNGIVNSTKAIDSARPQCDKKVVPKETLKNFDNEKPVLAINENTKKNSNGWKFSIPNHLFSNSEKRENEIDKKNKCFVSKFLKNKIESYQDKTQHIDTILFSNLPELTTDYRKFLFNEFVKNSVNTIHDKPNSLSHSDLVESNHINDSLDDFYQNTNFESTFTRNSTNRSTFKKIVNKLPKIKPEKNASQPKKSKYIIDNQGHKKEESFVTLTDSFDNMNVNSTIDISCNGDNSDQENTKLSISQLRRKIKNIGRQIDRNYNRKTKLLCSLPSIINPSKKHENSNGKRRKNEITESTAKIKKSLHV